LYDPIALDEAEQLARDWGAAEIAQLGCDAARHGLKAEMHGQSVQAIARQVLAIARRGLDPRNYRDAGARTESRFLDDLDRIAETGVTPAEALLQEFAGPWGGNVDPVFAAHCY